MITSKSLEIGKTYSLKYGDPWTGYDVYDVNVVSITNNEQSSQFSSDSIFSLFFSSYGFGIETYVNLMKTIPDIYVCQIVKGRDPLKIDTTVNYVVIPKAIVDFTNTEELLQCDSINVNINGLVNNFDLDIDRSNFNQSLIDSVTQAISTTPEFGSAPVNVTLERSTVLKPKDEFETYDAMRTSSYNLNLEAEIQIKAQFAKQQRDNLEKYEELQGKINSYNSMLVGVQEKLQELDIAISNYNNIKTDVHALRANINTMFNGLEDGSIVIDSAAYNTLKAQIESYIVNF